jgi:hypothetical protein
MSDIDEQFKEALRREATSRTADLQLPPPEELGPDAPAPRLEKLINEYGDLPCAQALRAWQARLNGSSIVEIAMQMGITVQTVKTLIDKVYQAVAEDLKEQLDQNRALDLARIDELIGAHLPKAKSGKVKSAAVVLRCLERRAKLIGIEPLPAPTQNHSQQVLVWIQAQLPSINKLVDSLPPELPPAAPGG